METVYRLRNLSDSKVCLKDGSSIEVKETIDVTELSKYLLTLRKYNIISISKVNQIKVVSSVDASKLSERKLKLAKVKANGHSLNTLKPLK